MMKTSLSIMGTASTDTSTSAVPFVLALSGSYNSRNPVTNNGIVKTPRTLVTTVSNRARAMFPLACPIEMRESKWKKEQMYL